MRKKIVAEKRKNGGTVKSFADLLRPSSSIHNSNDVFDDKKTWAIMWIAVPITNQNPGNFYRGVNELLAKNDMPKLNLTGHRPPEPNPTRLTVAPSAHKPNSNLDSPNVMHTSTSSINLSTTDLYFIFYLDHRYFLRLWRSNS